MDTKHDIPHREIGEQDDELLEQLWKQLPDSQEDPFIAGFKDLQGRIQRKLRIKRRFRILTAGSIAAALITGVLIFGHLFRRNRFLLPLRSYRIWGSLYLMIKLY